MVQADYVPPGCAFHYTIYYYLLGNGGGEYKIWAAAMCSECTVRSLYLHSGSGSFKEKINLV